jgi:hypothetical protein
MLWRNAPNSAPQVVAIQRSLNASGAAYGTSSTGYVTIWTAGLANSNGSSGNTQSLLFGVGAAQQFLSASVQSFGLGWPCLNFTTSSTSGVFNGSIPVWFLQPMVGIWDYPCTVVGVGFNGDLSEGVPFTITNQYGQTKTYMPSRAGSFNRISNPGGNGSTGLMTLCMEYD